MSDNTTQVRPIDLAEVNHRLLSATVGSSRLPATELRGVCDARQAFLDHVGRSREQLLETARSWISSEAYWEEEQRHFNTIVRLLSLLKDHDLSTANRTVPQPNASRASAVHSSDQSQLVGHYKGPHPSEDVTPSGRQAYCTPAQFDTNAGRKHSVEPHVDDLAALRENHSKMLTRLAELEAKIDGLGSTQSLRAGRRLAPVAPVPLTENFKFPGGDEHRPSNNFALDDGTADFATATETSDRPGWFDLLHHASDLDRSLPSTVPVSRAPSPATGSKTNRSGYRVCAPHLGPEIVKLLNEPTGWYQEDECDAYNEAPTMIFETPCHGSELSVGANTPVPPAAPSACVEADVIMPAYWQESHALDTACGKEPRPKSPQSTSGIEQDVTVVESAAKPEHKSIEKSPSAAESPLSTSKTKVKWIRKVKALRQKMSAKVLRTKPE